MYVQKSSLFSWSFAALNAIATRLANSFQAFDQRSNKWRSRRQLAELEDHQLADIDLSRDQADNEARKSFWGE